MSRPKRGKPRDVRLEAQAAAYLYSQGNDQAKIGAALAVSQGEVSRLLMAARREGWLQTRCVLPEGAVGAVEQIVFSGRNELRDRLRREADWHRVARGTGHSRIAQRWGVGRSGRVGCPTSPVWPARGRPPSRAGSPHGPRRRNVGQDDCPGGGRPSVTKPDRSHITPAGEIHPLDRRAVDLS